MTAFHLHAAEHSRVRLAPPDHVVVEVAGQPPQTLPRAAIELCEPMLVRVYRQRHDPAYAAPDPEGIVVRLQVHGQLQVLGPFPHREGVGLGAALELSRRIVLLARPGFSVSVTADQTALRIVMGGWEMPIPTAILVEARARPDMPSAAQRSIPTSLPLDATTGLVELAYLDGTSWVLGPLPRADTEVLAAEFARWRAQRPIDRAPIVVDAAELFANPTRWHGRRVSVVAPWEFGLERSWFGPAWLEVPPHAPVSDGSYRVRAIGTWIFPRLDGDGYGHMNCSPGELQAESIEILETFGQQQPKRDGLTGLLVRAAAGSELDRVRGQRPVAIAMLDLDRFKRVNDTHGHQTGDDVLRGFAKAMALRPTDLVVRWRADEIVAIMPATPIDRARTLLEHAVAAIAAIAVNGQPLGLTVSVGLVTLAEGESTGALFQRLDQTLLDAQRQGRNRIVLG